MKERLFRFKKFAVSHERSAMKVGFDAVLLGCWADLTADKRILDVGSGCGVISLICAQRNEQAQIYGIDIDSNSVEEAQSNYGRSPWANRLMAREIGFAEFVGNGNVGKFDHIISNPPFFSAGIDAPDSPRLQARHSGELSPLSLMYYGKQLLNDTGKLSMICPPEWLDEINNLAGTLDMTVRRIMYVKGNTTTPVKRVLIEVSNSVSGYMEEDLLVMDERGGYTDAYKCLTRDFYLKF